MKYDPVKLFDSADMSAAGTTSSIGISLQQYFMASIAAVWTGTGTATGTFNVQVSNDIVQVASGTNPGANVVNWQNYTGGTAATGGSAGTTMFNFATVPFAWIRLQYIRASGTGTMNAQFIGKG